MGEVLPAEGDQLLPEIRGWSDVWHRLHHRLYLFAKVRVGHAEYRRVGDPWMGDQQVLTFLRVDVDPTGDDHEGPPVGQIDVAVFVDIANVPDRSHRPIGRSRFGGFDRVLEVLERARRLEP